MFTNPDTSSVERFSVGFPISLSAFFATKARTSLGENLIGKVLLTLKSLPKLTPSFLWLVIHACSLRLFIVSKV